MPELKFSRSVSFSPEQMLDLVSDLKSYPEFVPNCSAMDITPVESSEGSRCDANMHVQFGPISQNYISRVVVDRQKMSVSATSSDSPFSHLQSCWRFTPAGEGARVYFEIDFAFSNPLIAAVAEPAFANMQGEVLDAFIAEAKRRYS